MGHVADPISTLSLARIPAFLRHLLKPLFGATLLSVLYLLGYITKTPSEVMARAVALPHPLSYALLFVICYMLGWLIQFLGTLADDIIWFIIDPETYNLKIREIFEPLTRRGIPKAESAKTAWGVKAELFAANHPGLNDALERAAQQKTLLHSLLGWAIIWLIAVNHRQGLIACVILIPLILKERDRYTKWLASVKHVADEEERRAATPPTQPQVTATI